MIARALEQVRMAKRRWTIVLVPHGSEPSRIVEVSWALLRGAASVLVVGVLVAFLLGYAVFSRTLRAGSSSELERQNRELAGEIGSLHARLNTLHDTLGQISQRDARIRLLANLDPIDPQVQAAGVGGPAPANHAELASMGVLGRRTAEIRVDVNALIRRANLLAQSFREAADSLKSHNDRLAATPSIMPTQGWLTSAFASMREHPILHIARPHEGIDVSAPSGTPIEAPAAGRVVKTGWETGYGNVVELDHGYGLVTRFAHASKILVRTGQRVSRGEKLALVGNTGLSTGPHLHYEVHVNGKPVDPLRYVLPDRAIAD
jgi:murein DD-endopeptidase MepM/ murein hydrolase activator NlpD